MKKRKYESIKNFTGIYKVLVSQDGISWKEPTRGCKYAASRYEIDGSHRSKKHFRTFDEAKNFRLRQGKSQMISTTRKDDSSSTKKEDRIFTFESAIKLYEDATLKNKAPSTQTRYYHYKKHLDFFNGKKVESIDTIVIDQWIAWLKRPEYLATQHSTRCTFKSEVKVLRNILNTYTSRINRNYRMPFIREHKAAIKVKEPVLIVKDLTPEEFRRFLDVMKELCLNTPWEYMYYLALFQYFTFSRIQDATALHFDDFNFARKEITLNKKLMFGRSKKEETTLHGGAKIDGGKIIPMSDLAARTFKEWTRRANINSGPLFTVKGSWPRYRWIEYRYTVALKKAGIKQSATHVLRHASLTEAQETSSDLNQTKVLAGHSSIRTTERYAKVRTNQIRETQNKFDEKMSQVLDGSHWFANEAISNI